MTQKFRTIEDDGLVTFNRKRQMERGESGVGSITSGNRDFTNIALEAARDLIKDQLTAMRPDLLDPFSPAEERRPFILSILRRAIGAQRERSNGPLMLIDTDDETLLKLYRDSIGWGPAQVYLDDPDVQEVKIIGDLIQIQERGRPFRTVEETFSTPRLPLERVMFLASTLGVRLNAASAQSTVPLGFRSRMHATIPPITPEDRALICIRRGRLSAWNLDDILRNSTCSPEVYHLMRHLVAAGCSFLIAGETGSGKTALLESLVNSWPGDPHVITIQDDTDEINVTHRAWTAETVQTSRDPLAFGKAAREVLRQTPTVVAPGEIRGSEAGAVLSIAMSGHAVVTTIHARNGHGAMLRFADFASMPNSHSYEGRRDSALEDACSAIDVVIHLSNINGMRVIDEISLANGVQQKYGVLVPNLVPLVRLSDTRVAEESEMLIGWECLAQPDRDAGLRWTQPSMSTPEGLAQKLTLLKHRARSTQSAPSSKMLVETTLRTVETLLLAGQPEQALVMLIRAWAERHDERLIGPCQRAMDMLGTMPTRREQSEALRASIEEAIRLREWDAARRDERSVVQSIELSAAHRPAGGWSQYDRLIRAGQRRDSEARELAERARAMVENGAAGGALDVLKGITPNDLSLPIAQQVLQTRLAAGTAMVQTGELQQRSLEVIESQLRGVERELAERQAAIDPVAAAILAEAEQPPRMSNPQGKPEPKLPPPGTRRSAFTTTTEQMGDEEEPAS